MENIRIFFVLSEKYSQENEASEIMLQAFQACRQNVNSNVSWIKESKFNSLELIKTDFVIFEQFQGKTFENLVKTKCVRILGPWAVNVCLMEGKSIPNFPWPIYNVAMYELNVTCSHLPKSVKMEIKEKVQTMGGCYSDDLLLTNTHLITGSSKSEKYLAAAEAGVKLMCPSWVNSVWDASQAINIHADNERFNKHHCLPFQGLTICCTGIALGFERRELENLINTNGGKFTGKLNLNQTDILVCNGISSTTSEKYKAARKQPNIKCVNISWVKDSIEKGYALPHHQYQLKKATSTPSKDDNTFNNPEFSVLSAIGVPNTSQNINIEDTYNNTTTNTTNNTTSFSSIFNNQNKSESNKRKASLNEDYIQLVDNLDIKKARRAGQFLDGCSVYLTGFSPEHMEKLCRILNLSGATRYASFSDRVTHVVVGDPSFHEVASIQNKRGQSLLVSIWWLLESIEKQQPAKEDKYLLSMMDFDNMEFSSPLSKKGLSLLRTNKTITEKEIEEAQDNNTTENTLEKDIVQQYLKPGTMVTADENDTLLQMLKDASNTDFSEQIQHPCEKVDSKSSETSSQQITASITQDESSQPSQMFQNLKFLIVDFDDADYVELKDKIEGLSGEVVTKTYKGIPDYAVLPLFNKPELHHTAAEIVNELFILECEKEGILFDDILYYHRPFYITDERPLQYRVITISGFSTYERSFLKSLIEALGGLCQDQFARVNSEAKGVVASTHLVSSEASGRKYVAAIKWGLPVVNKDWLLECAKIGAYVQETNYLLGESKALDNNKGADKERTEPIKSTSLSTPTHPSKELSSFKRSQNCGRDHKSLVTGDVSTPNSSGASKSVKVLTPVNQITPIRSKFSDSAEKPFSQVTPVSKIMKEFRESNIYNSSPNEVTSPRPWMNIKTPDTPLGAFITPNPSPGLRKEFEYWLQKFPDYHSPQRRLSTPLSDIKKQLWNKILKKGENADHDESVQDENEEKGVEVLPNAFTNPEESKEDPQFIDKLQQLQEMLSASGSGRRQSRNFQSTIPAPAGNKEFKDSQPCTVGWDFTEQAESPKKAKIFGLSGVSDEARITMIHQLESLGASVSEMSSYDPNYTHLLSPKPARNEKMLSCMAAGKWILHISYLEKSIEAGHFLNEEEYEFGNHKFIGKFSVQPDRETEVRMKSIHWWRKEVARRGYGAFNDMRAIVVAQKRDPIIHVIEAGGGVVIDVRPPFDDTVHATHCLLEQKSVPNFSEYIPLAQQGIYLVNTIYISDILHNPSKDIRDCILPFFSKYYSRT